MSKIRSSIEIRERNRFCPVCGKEINPQSYTVVDDMRVCLDCYDSMKYKTNDFIHNLSGGDK